MQIGFLGQGRSLKEEMATLQYSCMKSRMRNLAGYSSRSCKVRQTKVISPQHTLPKQLEKKNKAKQLLVGKKIITIKAETNEMKIKKTI